MANYLQSILAMVPAGDIRPDQLRTELNTAMQGSIANVYRYGDEITIETPTDALSTADQLLIPVVLAAHEPVTPVAGTGADYGNEFQYVYDQTVYTTTGTTMTTQATLSSAALIGGTYLVEATAVYNGDDTRSDAIVNLYEDGSPMGKSIRSEMKDSTGTEMGGSDAGVSANFRHLRTYAADAAPVFAIKHASENNGVLTGITDIMITILRVGD